MPDAADPAAKTLALVHVESVYGTLQPSKISSALDKDLSNKMYSLWQIRLRIQHSTTDCVYLWQ